MKTENINLESLNKEVKEGKPNNGSKAAVATGVGAAAVGAAATYYAADTITDAKIDADKASESGEDVQNLSSRPGVVSEEGTVNSDPSQVAVNIPQNPDHVEEVEFNVEDIRLEELSPRETHHHHHHHHHHDSVEEVTDPSQLISSIEPVSSYNNPGGQGTTEIDIDNPGQNLVAQHESHEEWNYTPVEYGGPDGWDHIDHEDLVADHSDNYSADSISEDIIV